MMLSENSDEHDQQILLLNHRRPTMIIWINGAFGSGKSSVAKQLNERIENSFVFDPEEAGFYLRDNLPKEMVTSDFQNITLWRQINYKVLFELSKHYSGTVIVPMTLVEPVYFDEIIGKLREEKVNLMHFYLKASHETLTERLLGRGEKENTWCFHQIERCIEASKNVKFEKYIDTEHRTIEDISHTIYDLYLIECSKK